MADRFDLADLGLDPASEVVRLVRRYPEIEARAYRDGEYLIREAEDSQEIFIVLRGALVVEQAALIPGGAPVMLAGLTAEPEAIAIVGEMAYLGDQIRTASIKAVAPTQCLRLKPSHIDAIIDGFPMLTRVICQQFALRLKEANDALRQFQTLRDL